MCRTDGLCRDETDLNVRIVIELKSGFIVSISVGSNPWRKLNENLPRLLTFCCENCL